MDGIFLLLGCLIGGIAGYGVFSLMSKWRGDGQREVIKESVVLLERIEKVFKVVLAEGHFSEIYDYNDHKEMFFGLKAGSKKALIVARAKVLVGYDFGKVKINWVEGKRCMVIEQMPEPEILSIDSDYNIYDIDQGLFNKFNKEEYTKLLSDAKQTIHNKAVASELPQVAQKQVQVLLGQLAGTMGWRIEYPVGSTLMINAKHDTAPQALTQAGLPTK